MQVLGHYVFYVFAVFYYFSKTVQLIKTKTGIRTIFIWKELRPNFCEIL